MTHFLPSAVPIIMASSDPDANRIFVGVIYSMAKTDHLVSIIYFDTLLQEVRTTPQMLVKNHHTMSRRRSLFISWHTPENITNLKSVSQWHIRARGYLNVHFKPPSPGTAAYDVGYAAGDIVDDCMLQRAASFVYWSTFTKTCEIYTTALYLSVRVNTYWNTQAGVIGAARPLYPWQFGKIPSRDFCVQWPADMTRDTLVEVGVTPDQRTQVMPLSGVFFCQPTEFFHRCFPQTVSAQVHDVDFSDAFDVSLEMDCRENDLQTSAVGLAVDCGGNDVQMPTVGLAEGCGGNDAQTDYCRMTNEEIDAFLDELFGESWTVPILDCSMFDILSVCTFCRKCFSMECAGFCN